MFILQVFQAISTKAIVVALFNKSHLRSTKHKTTALAVAYIAHLALKGAVATRACFSFVVRHG